MSASIHPILRPSMTLGKEDLDFQLSPSRSAKDAAGCLNGMVSATRDARGSAALSVTEDLRYAEGEARLLDLYQPDGQGLPLMVFVHGGFWQEGSKDVSGFAAEALGARGWASCGLGYPLAPGATLTDICTAVHEGVAFLTQNADRFRFDADRIVLVGHSAGAHLVACLLAGLPETGPCIAGSIAGAVLVSGVYELTPIARSYVNDLVSISALEERALSPLRHHPRADLPVHLLCGKDEPEAFCRQTEALGAQWAGLLPRMTVDIVPGRDHFDILQEIVDPTTSTSQVMAQMAARV